MTIAVLGNDNRQKTLAQLFKRKYNTVYISGNENLKQAQYLIKLADVVVLPLPVSRDNIKINSTDFYIDDIIKFTKPESIIFGGMTEKIKSDKKIIDYNLDEDFSLKNALYTAEGAVALSIYNTDYSLENAKILILGNGRIGKYLSKLFSPLCNKITVSARKQTDFEYIRSNGFQYVNTQKLYNLSLYDVIINTIPAKALTDNAIKTIAKSSLVIDLASKNSGLCACQTYIDAKALPTKFCALSSAEALFNSINKHLNNQTL